MIAPFLCWGVWLGSLHQVSTTSMVSRQLLPVVGVEGSATSQVTSTNNVQSRSQTTLVCFLPETLWLHLQLQGPRSPEAHSVLMVGDLNMNQTGNSLHC